MFLAPLLALVVGATAAHAHSGKQSYLYVSIFDTEVEGRVEMPIADLSSVLDIDIPNETGPALAALAEHRGRIQEYLDDHVTMGDGSSEWDLVYDDQAGILPLAEDSYALFPFRVDQSFDRVPRDFTVRFDVIYEADPDKDNLVIIENDWRSAMFANEGTPIIGLSTGMLEREVVIEDVSALSSIGAIRRLGTDTVRFQTEIVFLLAALILAVGVLSASAGNRDEAPSHREILRRGRSALLAFVLCQAVALWAVAAGSIELGERMTSSIAGLALFAGAVSLLMVWWQPALGRLLPLLAALSGAASGIVAGGAATRLDLHRSRFLLSLLSFHVGLVLAVAVIVMVLTLAVSQLRHSRLAPIIAAGVGIVFLALSMAWLAERLAGDGLQVDLIADQPEGLWTQLAVLVVLLIAAAGLRAYARQPGRHRPIHEQSST